MPNVTFEDVKGRVGKERAGEVWKQIGREFGFGEVPEQFDGGLAIPEGDKSKLDTILGGGKEPAEKKGGNS